MTVAYVGLGANICDPDRHMKLAIEALRQLPDTYLVSTSGMYRSAPLGYADQPDFLNAVAQLDTRLSPAELLDRLQDIEARHGRERSFPNAPRTLDLDLLLFGVERLATPRLTIPHARMHERAFVLKPLLELAPDVSIPGKGPARELLAACIDQAAERIDG